MVEVNGPRDAAQVNRLRRATSALLMIAIVGLALTLWVEYDYYVTVNPLKTGWLALGLTVFVLAGGGALGCWLASRRGPQPTGATDSPTTGRG